MSEIGPKVVLVLTTPILRGKALKEARRILILSSEQTLCFL